mmetsp:Transcript_38268/g.86903  ORF Transcript_38268/g.86903 Transcript_38268/m.86903 type:complete len:778 (+) Transcript_38268:1533-3866(+)
MLTILPFVNFPECTVLAYHAYFECMIATYVTYAVHATYVQATYSWHVYLASTLVHLHPMLGILGFTTYANGYTDHTHDYYGSHIPHSSPTLHTLLPLYTTLTTGDVPVQVYARLMPSTGEIVCRAVSKEIDHVMYHVPCACLEYTSLSLSEVKESNVGISCVSRTTPSIMFTNPYLRSTTDSHLRPLPVPVLDPISLLVLGPVPIPVPGEQQPGLMEQLMMEQLMEQLVVVEQPAAGRAPNAHAVGTIFDGRAKSAHGAWEDHGLASIASILVPDPIPYSTWFYCSWPPHACNAYHMMRLMAYHMMRLIASNLVITMMSMIAMIALIADGMIGTTCYHTRAKRRHHARSCAHNSLNRHATLIVIGTILMIATPTHAADSTDLPSADDLYDTLLGMIHHHGITHVMSTIATALPMAVSLPNSFDSHAHTSSTDRSTAILSAIAAISAFVAAFTNSNSSPRATTDCHDPHANRDGTHASTHDTPSWLVDAASTLANTPSHSDSDDDSKDDSHVNKPETSITPNPPNTTAIDQKYRGVTTHLSSGVHRGVMLDSMLDPRFDSHDDLSLTDGATHDGVLNDLGPNNDADHRGVMPDLLMINSSEPSLVSSITEPKPKLIEPKPKLIMNDDDDDDELLHTHAILPLHATPRYITIDDSITLQSRMIHEEMDAHVIDVMTLQARVRAANTIAMYWLLLNEDRYETYLENRHSDPVSDPTSESESSTIRNFVKLYHMAPYSRHRGSSRAHDWYILKHDSRVRRACSVLSQSIGRSTYLGELSTT